MAKSAKKVKKRLKRNWNETIVKKISSTIRFQLSVFQYNALWLCEQSYREKFMKSSANSCRKDNDLRKSRNPGWGPRRDYRLVARRRTEMFRAESIIRTAHVRPENDDPKICSRKCSKQGIVFKKGKCDLENIAVSEGFGRPQTNSQFIRRLNFIKEWWNRKTLVDCFINLSFNPGQDLIRLANLLRVKTSNRFL